MRIRFRVNYDKKGLLALDFLIGIILSVIALVLVVQLFSALFLNVPTNLKIAKDNAQSIKEFVDFSGSKYGDFKDCYSVLKLMNLENFQFEEDNKNYFYVIGTRNNKQGVFILELKYLADVINKESFSSVPIVDSFYFDKDVGNINLKLDSTSNTVFTFSMYIWTIGARDSGISLKPKDTDFMILVPKFNKDILGFDVSFLKSNQNILLGKSLYDGNFEEPEGFYLAIEPQSKNLFLSKSKYSNLLLSSSNCALKDSILQEYEKSILNSPKDADFVNYELVFDYETANGERKNFVFKWRVDGIVCPTEDGKSCTDYLGKDYNSLSYGEFFNRVTQVYKEKFKDEYVQGGSNTEGVHLIKINPLSIDDVKVGMRNGFPGHYSYENIFLEKELRKADSNDIEDILEENFGDSVYWDLKNNRVSNSCTSEECDYIGFRNSIAYFYNEDLKKFVLFNNKLLIKDKFGNIYYEGKVIKIKPVKFDDVAWSPLKHNYEFYLFDIETDKGSETVVLSQFQLNQIMEVN